MPEPDFFYLTVSSVSAVLLGICVTLRNNAFSIILRHFNEEIRLGNRDYETILEHSAYGAMASGLFFGVTIIGSFVGVFRGNPNNLEGVSFNVTMVFFGLGLVALLYALFAGHLKIEWPFRTPSKPDRSDRPDLKNGE